jgi:chemotaxis signal transduction protein
MNSECGNAIGLGRSNAESLEHGNGYRCEIGESPCGREWRRDEQPGTSGRAIGSKQWFCLFRGDAGPMAVPAESVAEVLETDTLVRLPWSPPQVIGVCCYHRDVIPIVVLDARAHAAREDCLGERNHLVSAGSAGEKGVTTDRTRRVVLILKNDSGAWGVPVDAANTIVSFESALYHAPRSTASGLVLIGTVERGGTSYRILDAQATWCCLRSAIGRWSGLIIESNPSSPLPSGESSVPAGAGL